MRSLNELSAGLIILFFVTGIEYYKDNYIHTLSMALASLLVGVLLVMSKFKQSSGKRRGYLEG